MILIVKSITKAHNRGCYRNQSWMTILRDSVLLSDDYRRCHKVAVINFIICAVWSQQIRLKPAAQSQPLSQASIYLKQQQCQLVREHKQLNNWKGWLGWTQEEATSNHQAVLSFKMSDMTLILHCLLKRVKEFHSSRYRLFMACFSPQDLEKWLSNNLHQKIKDFWQKGILSKDMYVLSNLS